MKKTTITFTTYSILFENGDVEIKTFTPTEYAGFKRSKKYKTKLSVKKIYSLEVVVKHW